MNSTRISGTMQPLHLPGAATEFADEYSKRFAAGLFRTQLAALFDPDRPKEDADELRNRMKGQHRNPNAMVHQCPSCERPPMSWTLFQAHALPCYIKHRKVVLDITKRKFAGGGPDDAGL